MRNSATASAIGSRRAGPRSCRSSCSRSSLSLPSLPPHPAPRDMCCRSCHALMILALAAMSLDLILGYGALVSFGHAAFLGIGAYAVGILIEPRFGGSA